MPRTAKTRGANGAGSIRQISIKRNGKQYKYWQARYTTGYDPGTGRQIQHTISGKTQKEVAQKLRQITVDIDNGMYTAPCDLTVGHWLELWLSTYLGSVKPRTLESYEMNVRRHIKPSLGAVKLNALTVPMAQQFYNDLCKPHGKQPGLSAKTIRCIHGVLHKALAKAVQIGYIRSNPTDACELPRVEKKEITPLNSEQITAFLRTIEDHPYKTIYVVTLFTGMRRGEVLGLTWDCVDFHQGIIRVNKQLQKVVGKRGAYELVSTKNRKGRTIAVAPSVLKLLKHHQAEQNAERLIAGAAWQNNNLVFCNALGENLSPHTVYHRFKAIMDDIGLPSTRFHDLRHSYAVAALSSGDDIKTVQGNLGHATAAFTLDVYGHVTDQMRRQSAERMDHFIKNVSNNL